MVKDNPEEHLHILFLSPGWQKCFALRSANCLLTYGSTHKIEQKLVSS